MPKNSGLKLFTKTWPLKRDKKDKDEEFRRPLTATLEKPTILDIRFIGKIDMSRVRKEFLNISNLCRMPLVIKQKHNINRPLSLLSTEMHRKSKKKRKTLDPNEDSHEDDESSIVQSAKINNCKNIRYSARSSGGLNGNKSVIHQFKQNNVLQIKNSVNDANNNKTLRVPSRKPILTTIPTPIPTPCPDPVKSSTKLPSPCRTCGRPDLPERFHSHPATPLKLSPRNKGIVSPVLLEKTQKLPVKSIVQKPVAIKYQSKNGSAGPRQISPLKKTSNHNSSLPVPTSKKTATLTANKTKESVVNHIDSTVRASSAVSEKETTMNGKSITPLRGGSGKRTLTCYICGREFGTASLSLHEPKCMEKWQRENASLPPNMRRNPPVKPDGNISQAEWNQLAWESSQAALVPCKNCGRTFYPDRLVVHQKSCKAQNNNNTKKASSNDTLNSTSSSPMSQNSDPSSTSTSTKTHQPPSVECYICGRMFGTHSIAIHEKKCLKKWHAENESLPRDMRSPAPTRQATSQNQPPQSPPSVSSTPSPKISKDERPASGAKSPLFPCYLCGKLFTVNSIYIHEPQCLKMWKIENDKLPPNKRRPVPLKPDVKFTPSGEVDFKGTFDRIWENHLTELVECKKCGRKFFPNRIEKHVEACIGLKIEVVKSKNLLKK